MALLAGVTAGVILHYIGLLVRVMVYPTVDDREETVGGGPETSLSAAKRLESIDKSREYIMKG